MRHLVGLLFGLVLAPVIWFLAALGHFRFLDALQRFGDDPNRLPSELAFGAMLIVAAGAWLGVLLSSRLSPLAPGAAGLLWLALGVGFVLDVERVSNLLPDGPTGQPGLFALPLEHAYAYLVGTALLSPLFSPARWRAAAAKPGADGVDVALEPVSDVTATGELAPPPGTQPRYGRTRAARSAEDTGYQTASELNQPAGYRNDPQHRPARPEYRDQPPRREPVADPRQLDPRQLDPRQVDPRQVDPRQVDPRQVDPRRAPQDPRFGSEPRLPWEESESQDGAPPRHRSRER
jgi:hypothetical protein